MVYASSTLTELRRLARLVNQSGIFPHGHSTHMATGHDLPVKTMRSALNGAPADIAAFRVLTEEAERLAGLKPLKVAPRKIRQLSIAELYHQSFLPAGYSELVAEKIGMKPNAVRYFIKNQLAGRTAYASSENTKEALYQIAEMNDEWELVCRLERVLEKLEKDSEA